jgi:hypothetical protein
MIDLPDPLRSLSGTFLSELVRRQWDWYKAPFAVLRRVSPTRAQSLQPHEGPLSFRWMAVCEQDGEQRLRMLCSLTLGEPQLPC